MRNKFFLIIITAIQILALFRWIASNSDFPNNFYYSSFDLHLRLMESIHNDINNPIWVVRLFHNKFTGSIFDVFACYLQFWSFQFLLNFISITGIVGILINFYYFFFERKREKIEFIFLALLLVLPLLEIFFLNKFAFVIRSVIMAIPFISWSILGYLKLFKKGGLNILFLSGIILLSLWFMAVKM